MSGTNSSRARIEHAYSRIDLDKLDPMEREQLERYLAPPFTVPETNPDNHTSTTTTPHAPKVDLKKVLTSFRKTANVMVPGLNATETAPDGNRERDVAPLIESSSPADLRKLASQLRLRVQSAENKAGYYNNLGCVLMWLNISSGKWEAAEEAFTQAAKLHDHSTGNKDAAHNLKLLNKARFAFVVSS